MTLTIDLPDEEIEALAAKARAQGISAEQYARHDPLGYVNPAHAESHAHEQEDRHQRIAGQVVKMTDPARLAADARELAVRVVDEIRQDDKQRACVGPGKPAPGKAQRAREADQQAQRGELIGRDKRVHKRRHKPASEPRVPCFRDRNVF